MNICSMRAQTLQGKLCEFTVHDIPVITGPDALVLLNRRFSPILKRSTIRLGSDVGVYVGDVLRDRDGSEWFVVYSCGFAAINMQTRERRVLYAFDKLVVTRQLSPQEEQSLGVLTGKFKFKYQGLVFPLMDIVGKYQDTMLVCGMQERVNLGEVQQDTGMSRNGKRVFYGDLYKGMPVIMCYGRISVQTEFGVYDILEGNYIMKTGGNN